MRLSNAIDKFASSGKHVFTVYDIAKMLGKSTAYASLVLSRSKKVHKIERGKYYIEGASIYEIASNVIYPSYVSMQAGLQYYELIDQNVIRYSIVTLKKHKSLEVNGSSINFIKTQKKVFFGYTEDNGSYIVSPDKLFIDCLYFRGVPFSVLIDSINEANRDKLINYQKIKEYAILIGSGVLISKLGFLLERAGINADDLLKYKYHSNISLSNTGDIGRSKKWGINYD